MYAREVDLAAFRLRELRSEERSDLALAFVAFALALGATALRPSLAMPLFLGGVGLGALGVRALWRRWDLVDRLAGEPAAYVIREVWAYGAREAGMRRRRAYAARIRCALAHPAPDVAGRIALVAEELEALATELEDERLTLDPACAVSCRRLACDADASPLLNALRPAGDLAWRIRRISGGFTAADASR